MFIFRFILFFCFSCVSLISYAEKLQCQPLDLSTQNEVITLNSASSGAVYFIQNKSENGIWLDDPSKKAMQAGWSSFLRKEKWSVLLSTRKAFVLNCSEILPGHVKYHDCKNVISICQVDDTQLKNIANKNYWVAEDISFEEGIKIATKRGVLKPL